MPTAFKSPRGEAEYIAAYEATMRLWPVPYEPMDLESRFGRTHLVACGPEQAPPLVLLHCFFTSLAVWAYNVAELSREHRVYALDMMGQPSKSIPDQPIRNREEMAEWLTDTLDQLGIGQMDLVGYSYGGFAALNYAMRAPGRVKKLVLLSPAGGLVPLWKQFYLRGILSLGIPSPSLRLSRFWANSWFNLFFYKPNRKDEMTQRIVNRLSEQFARGLRYFRLGAMVPPSIYADEELRNVRSATLLLIGREESLYDPVPAITRAKRLIPNIEGELVSHASHDLPVSLPAAVNQRILAFIAAAPGFETERAHQLQPA